MINTTEIVFHLGIMSFIDTLISYNYMQDQNTNYGCVVVYIEPDDLLLGDLADHIVWAATGRYYAPAVVIDSHRKLQPLRRSRTENYLNIFLFTNQSGIDHIENIRSNYYGNEHKLVILVSEEEDMQLSPNFTESLKILNRFMLLYRNNQEEIFDFKQDDSLNSITSHPIDMFNTTSVISAIDKVYERRLVNMHGRPLRVFIHFAPKWSALVPYDENNVQFVLQGPDVMVTDLIIPHLNATAILTTDIVLVAPNFAEWFHDYDGHLKNLRFRFHHRATLGRTILSDFNAR